MIFLHGGSNCLFACTVGGERGREEWRGRREREREMFQAAPALLNV